MSHRQPRPPCYAAIVTPPSIRLENLDALAAAAIGRAGLSVCRDSFGGKAVLDEDRDGLTLGRCQWCSIFSCNHTLISD